MRIFKAFDKAEDYVRGHLSKHPLFYAFLGGVFVVLFWRGVWETADILATRNYFLHWFLYGPNQIVFSTIVLMLMGLMVSVFVGEKIIISGLRHEKKVEDRTEEIIEEEVITLKHIRDEVRALKAEIDRGANGNIKAKVQKKK
jgi:hypothetical protein